MSDNSRHSNPRAKPSDLPSSNKQWLSVHLTHFALNLAGIRADSEDQAAVVSYQNNVWQTNKAAEKIGIRQSMSINQMMLLTDFKQSISRQPKMEKRRLGHLAYWAYRFTPIVVIYDEQTLLLEIGRSSALFQNTKNIIKLVANSLNEFGFDCTFGLGNTPKASYLLGFNGHTEFDSGVQMQHLERIALTNLPVANKLKEQFERCGFHSLKDLKDIENRELGSRFGSDLLHYLAQLYGQSADPQIPISPPETFVKSIEFAEPIKNWNWIEQQQLELLHQFVEFIQTRQLACDEFKWQLVTEHDAEIIHAQLRVNFSTIALLPKSEQAARLYELTRLKFETLNITSSICRIELRSLSLTPLALKNRDLFNNTAHQEDFELLKDKLTSRLGQDAVYQLETQQEHLPENSYKQVRRTNEDHASYSTSGSLSEPNWLFESPKPLSKKSGHPYHKGPLDLIHGPQRIVHNWWDVLQSRDYFIARQVDGQLIWIFKDRTNNKWFIHGLYG